MRSPLLSLLRFVVLIIQMAGLMAYFVQYVGWNPLLAVIVSVLLATLLPLAATILGFLGAIHVWGWSWGLALLVFLPGLALSLAAMAGIGAASLFSVLALKRMRRQGGPWHSPGGPGGAGWGGRFGGRFGRGGFGQGSSGQGGFGQEGQPHDGAAPEDHSQSGNVIEGEVISSHLDNDTKPKP